MLGNLAWSCSTDPRGFWYFSKRSFSATDAWDPGIMVILTPECSSGRCVIWVAYLMHSSWPRGKGTFSNSLAETISSNFDHRQLRAVGEVGTCQGLSPATGQFYASAQDWSVCLDGNCQPAYLYWAGNEESIDVLNSPISLSVVDAHK